MPSTVREKEVIYKFWENKTSNSPPLTKLFADKTSSNIVEFVQFLLDPSVVPEVILGCQEDKFKLSDIFELTRTFCYAIHRRRLQLIGRFNYN